MGVGLNGETHHRQAAPFYRDLTGNRESHELGILTELVKEGCWMNALTVSVAHQFRYYLMRWVAIGVALELVNVLIIPPTSQDPWYVPCLVAIGLVFGAIGASVFLWLQRARNARNSRVQRVANAVAAATVASAALILPLYIWS
jgi:H+/Cl- antiporter ClcA